MLPVWIGAVVHLISRIATIAPVPAAVTSRIWRVVLHPQVLLLWLWGWALFVYSFNAHKEFRFILPVLPIGFMYCGYGLAQLETAYALTMPPAPPLSTASGGSDHIGSKQSFYTPRVVEHSTFRERTPIPSDATHTGTSTTTLNADNDDVAAAPARRRRCQSIPSIERVVWFLVLSNVALFTYFGRWHQAGPISAMNFLHSHITARSFTPAVRLVSIPLKVLMLLPYVCIFFRRDVFPVCF
jgi:hypothetical protein